LVKEVPGSERFEAQIGRKDKEDRTVLSIITGFGKKPRKS
jgi:hypothetical protein